MNFEQLKNLSESLKLNGEIKGLIETLSKFQESFQNEIDKYNKNYISTWNNTYNGLKNVLSKIEVLQDKDDNIIHIDQTNLKSVLTSYIETFKSVSEFSILKYTDKNVVLVGPNGSGKTSFLNFLMASNQEIGIEYFPSERLFINTDSEKFPMSIELFLRDFNTNRQNMLDRKNNYRGTYHSKDFGYSIALLVYSHNAEMQKGTLSNETKAQKILSKWSELIVTRRLVIHDNQVFGVYENIEYTIDNLSSGEKSMLYFLINILLREKQNYYVIDEPENSLNSSILSKLWTFIENERRESIFIYLTHDGNFVMSRNNCDKYWMKNYSGSSKWEFVILPESEYLPEKLMIELVGTKQPIIFVESEDESKYDFKLYSLMFPEFKVVPVKGSDQVKFKTKAYNNLHINKAFGIIDCDYFDDSYLEGFKKHNVYFSPFFEVENLLVCEEIIESVLSYYTLKTQYQIEEIKKLILSELLKIVQESNDIICEKMTTSRVRELINNIENSSDNQIKVLENHLNKVSKVKIIDIKTQCQEVIDSLKKDPSHNLILRYLDYKNSILKRLGRFTGMKNYDNEIVNYLSIKGANVLKEIRTKYFPAIRF